MTDTLNLNDVSTKDTGKGSKFKTGGRREHNMPGEACNKYSGKEKQDCLNYKGRFAKKKKKLLAKRGREQETSLE